MKLYIKQKVFSVTDKYDIYDSNGNIYFDVQGEFFTFGAKLHLFDMNGNELFYIRRHITFLLAEFEIYRMDTLCAAIHQQLSLFRGKLEVESSYGNFEIDGDLWGLEYSITCNGAYFGSVKKAFLSWGDSYELDIPVDDNSAFFCALVIAIDNALHNKN